MSDSEKEYQLIVKYLDGNLDDEEQTSFDQLMESSEGFRKELANTETILASLKVSDRKKRFQEVKDTFQELDQRKKEADNKNIKSYWVIGIAATISLVIVSYLLFMNNNSQVSSEELYVEYFEPFPVEAGGSRINKDDLNIGLVLYGKSKYKDAIPQLKKLIATDTSVMNNIYLASAYLGNNQFSEAEKLLISIQKEQLDAVMKRFVEWYLSLSLMAQGNMDEAKTHLEILSKSSGYYQEEATKILDRLNE